MAGIFYQYKIKAVPSSSVPETIAQINAAANHRVLLHGIDVTTDGSAGTSSGLEFEVCVQDDALGLTDDSSAIQAEPPAPAETRQTTALKSLLNATEPTTNTFHWGFGLHQQSHYYWTPPGKPAAIVGGSRMGLRLIAPASFSPSIIVVFFFEE